jgi:hypothetical protein
MFRNKIGKSAFSATFAHHWNIDRHRRAPRITATCRPERRHVSFPGLTVVDRAMALSIDPLQPLTGNTP